MKVEALCISDEKGTAKRPVQEARFVAGHGIEGDAHAGETHQAETNYSVHFLVPLDVEIIKGAVDFDLSSIPKG